MPEGQSQIKNSQCDFTIFVIIKRRIRIDTTIKLISSQQILCFIQMPMFITFLISFRTNGWDYFIDYKLMMIEYFRVSNPCLHTASTTSKHVPTVFSTILVRYKQHTHIFNVFRISCFGHLLVLKIAKLHKCKLSAWQHMIYYLMHFSSFLFCLFPFTLSLVCAPLSDPCMHTNAECVNK